MPYKVQLRTARRAGHTWERVSTGSELQQSSFSFFSGDKGNATLLERCTNSQQFFGETPTFITLQFLEKLSAPWKALQGRGRPKSPDLAAQTPSLRKFTCFLLLRPPGSKQKILKRSSEVRGSWTHWIHVNEDPVFLLRRKA